MFSVVIPVYNKGPYIVKAIYSVINQSFKEFELILIDDGSTDDSVQQAQTIKDNRIKLIRQENKGVSHARNYGVEAATYKYVAFLDADDWWDIHFLKEMNQLIHDFPRAGIYGCNYYYVDKGKYLLSEKGFQEGFHCGYIDYFKVYSSTLVVPFNCSFVIVDKYIFNQSGRFDPKLKFGEDLDLWIRIALKYKVAYLNKPLAYSNQDSDPSNRAVGSSKLYRKDELFVFNLDYLEPYEKTNYYLKLLLDRSRTQLLLPYYKGNMYLPEIREILNHVNFKSQPYIYHIIYSLPYQCVEPFLYLIHIASIIKRSLINTGKKLFQ